MLNMNAGTADTIDGRNAVRTGLGVRGHVLVGPYERLQPGRYAVEFQVQDGGDGEAQDQDIVAVLDVVTDNGQTAVVFDYVDLAAAKDGRPLRLEFDVTQPQDYEYRVHANGNRSLVVADEPLVSVRDGADLPVTRVPMGAMNYAQHRMLQRLMESGVRIDFDSDRVVLPFSAFDDLVQAFLAFEPDRKKVARAIAEAAGFKGNEENSLYRGFVGTERPMISPPQPVPFSSTLCQQAHFTLDQYRFWARALKETPKFARKQWEFIYIAQALFERGYLEPGTSGLVFGAGQEPLPALFASFGVKVLATDQAAETAVNGGWIASGQHTYDLAALNERHICTDRMFNELVSYRSVDMNDIPSDLDGQFDFCWSACAFEHLGSIQHGLDFVENSLKTLKPGGIAIHTTEFNLSSNDDTYDTVNLAIYRRRDIEGFLSAMADKGYVVSPVDWERGEGFAEIVADLPPYGRGEPHIRLHAFNYDCTSIGLIIQKPS